MKTKELIEAVKNERGSAFQNCNDCEYGTHNGEVIEKLKRLAELEDKIEQGKLIEFPRVVERKIPFNNEGCIDFEKGTTVWDLEEMKPNGVVVTRFLYESSAMDRLKELQE